MTGGNKLLVPSLVLVALFALYPAVMLSCSKTPHYELSRFISPETCGGCHADIYAQWKNSMHNLSQGDIIYRLAAFEGLKGLADKNEIAEAEHCVICHNPVGYVSGFPKTTSDEKREDRIAAITKEGVQCDFCHSATGARHVYNAAITLDPGHGEEDPGVKRGPFADAKSDYHKSAFSKFHTQSEACGVCHDVRHVAYGTRLETTYEEWTKSPYNSSDESKRVVCQGCHMHQRPGGPATGSTARPANPGTAAEGGPPRPHLFTHYFVGGNRAIPGMSGDALKAKMAEERLRHAAELAIDASSAREGKVLVTVKNTGAGHNLPTGLTDVRQMWLEVTVKGAGGKVVFSSGVADANGYLPDGAVIFNTVFGDGKGNAVSNIAKAKEVLRDRRVPSMGSLTETYTFAAPGAGKLTVEARLLYRSASQKLVDGLAGRGKLRLPVTVMAEVKASL